MKTCKHCGSDTHYAISCFKAPKKPIKRVAIRKTGKLSTSTTKALKRTRNKSERSKAKKLAWDTFSIYIRTRDCMRFTGKPDKGKCVTCNKPYDFKKLQAGHFIQGRGNAVLFDERIVHSQCGACNRNPPYGLGGNYVEYFVFMEREYGRDKIEEFRALKHTEVIYKTHDFVALTELYKQKTADLIK